MVLGAGGVLGHAHVGVLEVFDEAGIAFDRIVGSSIGAVVGALYGSGIRGGDLVRLAQAVRPRHWLDFSLNRMGLVAGKRLETVLRFLTRDRRLEQLTPPLVVVATDIEAGEKVVMNRGPAAPAVMASSAVPGLFPPVTIEGRRLMDGAILERVPVSVARDEGANLVVAVSLGFPAGGAGHVSVRNALDVVTRSFDLMQREISRFSVERADVHIVPRSSEWDGPPSPEALLEEGRRAAREALPSIRALMSSEKVVS